MNLYYQCEVSSHLWFRDLESRKIHIQQATNLH